MFAAPPPRPRRSVLTVLHPLSPTVWAATLVSLPLAQAALCLLARAEEALAGLDLREWSLPARAAWYGFGTLLGESITRDTKSEGAWALRLVFKKVFTAVRKHTWCA